jgi:hypothetical protein
LSEKPWKPQERSAKLLNQCHSYFEQYSEFATLKQVFYLMVEDGLLRNDVASWRKFRTLVFRAKKHGRLPSAVFPSGRYPEKSVYVPDAHSYLQKAVNDFKIPRTFLQDNHVEIWVERTPLSFFVEYLFQEYGIPVYTVGGYASFSFVHAAAQRLQDSAKRAGSPRIIYLGDFNSGSSKTFEALKDDLTERLKLQPQDVSSMLFKAAVLPEHIVKYNLPLSFTKVKEKPSDEFVELYKESYELLGMNLQDSVEVEAINPLELATMLNNIVLGLLDQSVMIDVARREEQAKLELKKVMREAYEA